LRLSVPNSSVVVIVIVIYANQKNLVVIPEHRLPNGAANFLRQQGILAGWGPVARKSNILLFLFSVTDC
jgi:hypothetical protein